MKCNVCKTDNESYRIFCSNCGEILPVKRHICGFINLETDKYCGGCGASLIESELDSSQFIEHKSQGDYFSEIFSEKDIQNILIENSEQFVSRKLALSQVEIEKLFKTE